MYNVPDPEKKYPKINPTLVMLKVQQALTDNPRAKYIIVSGYEQYTEEAPQISFNRRLPYLHIAQPETKEKKWIITNLWVPANSFIEAFTGKKHGEQRDPIIVISVPKEFQADVLVLAELHALAEDGVGVLEADELVLRAHRGRDARKVLAAVDLVHHHLEVERIAGVGVDRLVGVAELAEAHLAPPAAVELQRSVAGVALRGRRHLPHRRRRAAGGDEVEHRVGDQRRALVGPLDLRADGVRERRRIAGRQRRTEGVAEEPAVLVEHRERALGLERGLIRRGAVLRGRVGRVVVPVARERGREALGRLVVRLEAREREADARVVGVGGRGGRRTDGDAESVHQLEVDRRDARRVDGGRDDRRGEPGARRTRENDRGTRAATATATASATATATATAAHGRPARPVR